MNQKIYKRKIGSRIVFSRINGSVTVVRVRSEKERSEIMRNKQGKRR